jgi:hypothetical protein
MLLIVLFHSHNTLEKAKLVIENKSGIAMEWSSEQLLFDSKWDIKRKI